MQWLIAEDILQKAPHGNLMLYRRNWNNQEILHAAKIIDEYCILSKWGTGCIFKHDDLVVPLEYGEKLDRFNSLPPDCALIYFKQYLENLIKKIKDITT